MVEEFDTSKRIAITITHKDLIASLTGVAAEGIDENGKEGVLIFIPTSVPEILIDLLKV